MNRQKMTEVSLALPILASLIQEYLEEKAGEVIPFTLLVGTDKVVQYVSNINRQESIDLIESLLHRFRAGRANIPAHYNPDLKEPQA